MKKLLIAFMALSLFSACDNSDKRDTAAEDKREAELKAREDSLRLKEEELKARTSEAPEPATEEKQSEDKKPAETKPAAKDFQSDPVKIMQAIFNAASSEDYSKLMGLCDPEGNSDADTKLLCNMHNLGDAAQQTFKVQFAFGKVVGTPEIDGEKAKVKFKYGLNAKKDGTMEMVKRNGKWYLLSY